ncbi:secretory phospholipase A2 receptor-like [Hyposmocoma kahamanoa]|uniref:secretory phospholipase A2 receptor-like n=1 Tax=Hyposmocoma kahamanoa TaxID=1477025 RepID=UPI000E6D830F|nr:secretory phospholipase A2 receptor-like [Hyposmocoma kahamanoa]
MHCSKRVLTFLAILLSLRHTSDGQKHKRYFRSDYIYLPISNGFYKVHQQPRNWSEADLICGLEGASLFYPESKAEADEVLKLGRHNNGHKLFFVGVHDVLGNGEFKTVDGRLLSEVYNFIIIEDSSRADGTAKCATISTYYQTGTVAHCSKTFPFICKKPFDSLQWNQDCDAYNLDYKYNGTLGGCYKFHLNTARWIDAFNFCQLEESYLAIIDSQAESDFFVEMANITEKEEITSGSIHLGFSKIGGNWITVKNTSLPYPKWGYMQPDLGDDRICGAMLYNGDLNDVQCEERTFFICERDVKNNFPKV